MTAKGQMKILLKLIFVGGLIAGVLWVARENAEEAASKLEIPMPAYARTTLENLDTVQAREIINADGKSCPMVTGGRHGVLADTLDPYAVVSCSDGERYLIHWDSANGHLDALSCSWGAC